MWNACMCRGGAPYVNATGESGCGNAALSGVSMRNYMDASVWGEATAHCSPPSLMCAAPQMRCVTRCKASSGAWTGFPSPTTSMRYPVSEATVPAHNSAACEIRTSLGLPPPHMLVGTDFTEFTLGIMVACQGRFWSGCSRPSRAICPSHRPGPATVQ